MRARELAKNMESEPIIKGEDGEIRQKPSAIGDSVNSLMEAPKRW